jgi:hypothetical protein
MKLDTQQPTTGGGTTAITFDIMLVNTQACVTGSNACLTKNNLAFTDSWWSYEAFSNGQQFTNMFQSVLALLLFLILSGTIFMVTWGVLLIRDHQGHTRGNCCVRSYLWSMDHLDALLHVGNMAIMIACLSNFANIVGTSNSQPGTVPGVQKFTGKTAHRRLIL